MKNRGDSSYSIKDGQNKNFMVLKLLSHVPEFKKDVSEIRRKMGINENGFEWNKSEMWEWATKKDIEYYQGVEQVGDDDEWWSSFVSITPVEDKEVRKHFPSNTFEKKMFNLGTKYKLPFNFYAFPSMGLPRFILSGEIEAPRQNYYTSFHEAGDETIWTSLTAYAPLSAKELKEAMNELKDNNMDVLSTVMKGVDVLARKRYRNNMQRDLILLNEQSVRFGKPKLIKHIKQGSYLDFLSKDKTVSNKTTRRFERLNKKDVIVEYDKPTSKQIGRKLGVSGDATRQAKRRLNLFAKELFGYGLEP